MAAIVRLLYFDFAEFVLKNKVIFEYLTWFLMIIRRLLLIVLFIPIISCRQDDNDDTKPCKPWPCQDEFRCVIDGTPWSPESKPNCREVETYYYPEGYQSLKPGFLSIATVNCAVHIGDRLYIVINGVTEPSTFNLMDTNLVRVTRTDPGVVDYNMPVNGEIKITLIQADGYDEPGGQRGRVQGTFWMTLANNKDDTIHLTEGAFDVPLR
ncbi:MAG: hypothetical protein RLP14_08985 [Owenweeksia sp.]